MGKIIDIYDDKAALKDLLNSEKKGLEYLFKKYHSFLVKFSIQIVKREEVAEDIVQDLFFKLWGNRKQKEQVQHIKSYLFQSVKNQSINFLKSSKSNIQSDDLYKFDHLTKNNVDELVQYESLQESIQKVLLKLPEKCRIIFKLSRFEQKSYKEIADKLNISIKTVENQMGKALKIMREELKEFVALVILLFLL